MLNLNPVKANLKITLSPLLVVPDNMSYADFTDSTPLYNKVMEGRRMEGINKKGYDDEFKASALKMVIEKGRAINKVSRSLDLSEPVLRHWVNAAKKPENIDNSRVK